MVEHRAEMEAGAVKVTGERAGSQESDVLKRI